MQVNVEVAPAPLAGRRTITLRRRPREPHRRSSQGEAWTVGTTPIHAHTPSEPACRGHSDRSGFTRQRLGASPQEKLGHARSAVTSCCEWRQITKFVAGQDSTRPPLPIIASLAAYYLPMDLGRSSATSQLKVRSSSWPSRTARHWDAEGRRTKAGIAEGPGNRDAEAAPEMRYLRIRLRECRSDRGPFPGFLGSAAPQRHSGRRLGVWLVGRVGISRPEMFGSSRARDRRLTGVLVKGEVRKCTNRPCPWVAGIPQGCSMTSAKPPDVTERRLRSRGGLQ
jgi:hypothetical protein